LNDSSLKSVKSFFSPKEKAGLGTITVVLVGIEASQTKGAGSKRTVAVKVDKDTTLETS